MKSSPGSPLNRAAVLEHYLSTTEGGLNNLIFTFNAEFHSPDLFSISAQVYAQRPQLDIHSFEGNFTRISAAPTESRAPAQRESLWPVFTLGHTPGLEDAEPQVVESLSIENTLWASTVVASGPETLSVLNCCRTLSGNETKRPQLGLIVFPPMHFILLHLGTVIGVVIYTGKETRSVLNTSNAKNKLRGIQYLKKMMSEVSIRRLEIGDGKSMRRVGEASRGTFRPHIICCDIGPGTTGAPDQSDGATERLFAPRDGPLRQNGVV
ncbi:putative phospholipid-transporting ATPase IIB [Liparis tanakae]|uniref:Putative phospholipid-transporting ATPase IIB n=1 Tax=Liparis tanakae TaxID=230148 RepID=A0A4Z2HTF3_9TELE|nr:putative phospholipid-transporting ATPase IIB [Liparis tanakae]